MHKVVIVGDSHVGKTSLIHRLEFKDDDFSEIKPTITGNSTHITTKYNDTEIKLDIWDTAGTEAYQSLAPMYARNAQVCLCVFDLHEPDTLASIPGWKEMMQNSEQIPYYIVIGNKSDLEKRCEQQKIEEVMGEDDNDYIEVSAKTGFGCENLLDAIAERILRLEKHTKSETVNIDQQPATQQSGCQC